MNNIITIFDTRANNVVDVATNFLCIYVVPLTLKFEVGGRSCWILLGFAAVVM